MEVDVAFIALYIWCCFLNADPNVARQRMEAMEAARRRLQEQHDAQAARYAEEAKKVLKNLKCVENWSELLQRVCNILDFFKCLDDLWIFSSKNALSTLFQEINNNLIKLIDKFVIENDCSSSMI